MRKFRQSSLRQGGQTLLNGQILKQYFGLYLSGYKLIKNFRFKRDFFAQGKVQEKDGFLDSLKSSCQQKRRYEGNVRRLWMINVSENEFRIIRSKALD